MDKVTKTDITQPSPKYLKIIRLPIIPAPDIYMALLKYVLAPF